MFSFARNLWVCVHHWLLMRRLRAFRERLYADARANTRRLTGSDVIGSADPLYLRAMTRPTTPLETSDPAEIDAIRRDRAKGKVFHPHGCACWICERVKGGVA